MLDIIQMICVYMCIIDKLKYQHSLSKNLKMNKSWGKTHMYLSSDSNKKIPLALDMDWECS